jgi:hypothetical protein
MDSCVLVPDEFSLVLTLHHNPRNVMEMSVALWSNTSIPPGTVFHSEQGSFRLEKLEIYSKLATTDVSIVLLVLL